MIQQNTNDNRTADDNLAALQLFYRGFPEFASNDFYIAGESYAGIYVPTLANAIRVSNEAGKSFRIHLKGFMVGNGFEIDISTWTKDFKQSCIHEFGACLLILFGQMHWFPSWNLLR
jgi:carboxypeptidase C (cathepsin A)